MQHTSSSCNTWKTNKCIIVFLENLHEQMIPSFFQATLQFSWSKMHSRPVSLNCWPFLLLISFHSLALKCYRPQSIFNKPHFISQKCISWHQMFRIGITCTALGSRHLLFRNCLNMSYNLFCTSPALHQKQIINLTLHHFIPISSVDSFEIMLAHSRLPFRLKRWNIIFRSPDKYFASSWSASATLLLSSVTSTVVSAADFPEGFCWNPCCTTFALRF